MELARILMEFHRQLIIILDTVHIKWARVMNMHYILMELPIQLIMLLDAVHVELAHILNGLQWQTRHRLKEMWAPRVH